MNDKEMQSKVLDIVAKVARLKELKVNPDKDIRDQVNLDSMQFVAVIAHIEEAFQVDLPIEVMTVSTFRQFLSMLKDAIHVRPNDGL